MKFYKTPSIFCAALFLLSGFAFAAEPCNESLIAFEITPASDIVAPGELLKVATSVENLEQGRLLDARIRLQLVESDTRKVVVKLEEKTTIESRYGKIRQIAIPMDARNGEYALEEVLTYSTPGCDGQASAAYKIRVEKPFWENAVLGIPLWLFGIILVALAGAGFFAYKKYSEKKESQFQMRFKLYK